MGNSPALLAKSTLFSRLPCCGSVLEVLFLPIGSSWVLKTHGGEHCPPGSICGLACCLLLAEPAGGWLLSRDFPTGQARET